MTRLLPYSDAKKPKLARTFLTTVNTTYKKNIDRSSPTLCPVSDDHFYPRLSGRGNIFVLDPPYFPGAPALGAPEIPCSKRDSCNRVIMHYPVCPAYRAHEGVGEWVTLLGHAYHPLEKKTEMEDISPPLSGAPRGPRARRGPPRTASPPRQASQS